MRKLSFLILMILLPMLTSAAVKIDGIYYNLDSGAKTAEVTENPNKYQGDVTIPGTFEYGGTTYSVTAIGQRAFAFCRSLTSVTMCNSVTFIGDYAFSNCNGLISITIPDGVTSIGEYNQEIKGETNVEIIPVSA